MCEGEVELAMFDASHHSESMQVKGIREMNVQSRHWRGELELHMEVKR